MKAVIDFLQEKLDENLNPELTAANEHGTPIQVNHFVARVESFNAAIKLLRGDAPTNLSEMHLHEAATKMRNIGGSFAAYIAIARFVADSTNRAILEKAFAHLFEKFAPDGTTS